MLKKTDISSPEFDLFPIQHGNLNQRFEIKHLEWLIWFIYLI